MNFVMSKILFISKHNPCKPSGGGLATRSYIEMLSAISEGNIDLCLSKSCNVGESNIKYDRLLGVGPRSILSKCCSLFTGEMHRFTNFVRSYLKDNHKEYEYCVFDHSSISASLVDYVNKLGLKTITIHHNYEPEYFWDNRTNLIRDFLLLQHVKINQKKAYLESRYNLFLTNADKDKFIKTYGSNNGINGVIGCSECQNERIYSILDSNFNTRLKLVITGSLCTVQTIDAIDYFFSELYAYLPEDVEIVIAGRQPTESIVGLCEKYNNVRLIPNPQNISEIIANGDIYICPTRVGGGLKLRIMDGLRLGLPVISHNISCRGFDSFQNTNFFYGFDSPKSFRKALDRLIVDINSKAVKKDFIQKEYLKKFSFNAGVERMKSLIDYGM
ncbi:glycosyltransferase [Puteibacter caeruleilacunae]|nr:glycosyltransferase [Puteibacter caeruleilacunae]